MKRIMMCARSRMIGVFTSPAVFVLVAFMVSGMFTTAGFSRYRGLIEVNVLFPWGLALALVRLHRAKTRPIRADVCVLALLFSWLVVPFALRFGPTAADINTWQSVAAVFFGVFALLAEMDERELGRHMDIAAALGACISFVFAGTLLYCAVTVKSFGDANAEFNFGVYQYAQLCAAQHYNATGMLAMCGAFMCLMGAERGKNRTMRVLYLIPAIMMALVVILTQSRTARYSLLIGLAIGAYGAAASRNKSKKRIMRHAAGILAGFVVLAGGYVFCAKVTDAALVHYAKARAGVQTVSFAALAVAEEESSGQVQSSDAAAPEVKEARGIGEGTFTGRTILWGNIFRMWKNNPKYFLIGNGAGRTSRDILIGTPLEDGGANMAHNAYIQFVMDYGLIGFAMLCVFFVLLLLPALRALLAAPGSLIGGSRAMVMLTAACLMTGMMENEPLCAMRPCNVILMFALGVIACAGTKAQAAR